MDTKDQKMQQCDLIMNQNVTASISDTNNTHDGNPLVAQVAVAVAIPAAAAAIPIEDDVYSKYSKFDYNNERDVVVATVHHEATNTGVQTPPINYPYVTSYDPELERQIANEATRRGRILSQQEINDLRFINYKAKALQNQEQQKAHVANLNAQYQNYQEETGLIQTSTTIPTEAIPITTTKVISNEDYYSMNGTYGTGGYEISNYETNTYETSNYETTEYKSVYD